MLTDRTSGESLRVAETPPGARFTVQGEPCRRRSRTMPQQVSEAAWRRRDHPGGASSVSRVPSHSTVCAWPRRRRRQGRSRPFVNPVQPRLGWGTAGIGPDGCERRHNAEPATQCPAAGERTVSARRADQVDAESPRSRTACSYVPGPSWMGGPYLPSYEPPARYGR